MNMDSRTTGRFRNLLRALPGGSVREPNTEPLAIPYPRRGVWGSAFMAAIKAGLTYFPPVLFAALRYDVAGVVMLAYAAYVVDDPIPRGRDEWTTVAVGATLIIAAYHAFLFIGESDPAVTSAVAAVIVSLSPVLTTVFARAFLPRRLTLVGVGLGLVVGLAGAVVLAAPDPSNLTGGGTVAKLLVLLAAASFALGSVLTRASDDDLPIETMEAWSMLLGAPPDASTVACARRVGRRRDVEHGGNARARIPLDRCQRGLDSSSTSISSTGSVRSRSTSSRTSRRCSPRSPGGYS